MNTFNPTEFNNTHGVGSSSRIVRRVSTYDIENSQSIDTSGLKANQKFDSVEGIQHPGLNDVLSGRGSAANNHIGNIRFREMVKKYQDRYRSASKADKPIVALEIVLRWKALSPPGRFLTKSAGKGDDLWHEISEEKATRKVAQRLRETDSSFAASQLRRRERHERMPSHDGSVNLVPADTTTASAIARCSSNISLLHVVKDDSSVAPMAMATPMFTSSMDDQLEDLYAIVQEDSLHDIGEDSSNNEEKIGAVPLAADLLDVF